MPLDYFKHGDWNALCDVCGWKFKASQLKKRWDGFMVCEQDWEVRHPQDFIKAFPDGNNVPWVRKDPGAATYDGDSFVEVSYPDEPEAKPAGTFGDYL